MLAAHEHEHPCLRSRLGGLDAGQLAWSRRSTAGYVTVSGLDEAALADWYAGTTMGPANEQLQEMEPLVGAGRVDARVRPPTHGRRSASSRSAAASPATSRSASCPDDPSRTSAARRCPYWGYFCQISDSTTSYGSYSGAIPSEKITWGKLEPTTPRFMINSDASIVAPIIFEYVLG